MRGAVRDYLNPLTLDSLTVSNPNTLAVAITAMSIAGIRVRLLHRPVGIEDIQVIGKRCVGILNIHAPTIGFGTLLPVVVLSHAHNPIEAAASRLTTGKEPRIFMRTLFPSAYVLEARYYREDRSRNESLPG